jgi:putative flippase GtrA
LGALVLWFSFDATIAKAIAFVLAVLSSFAGNHFWTYRDSRSKPLAKQLAQFAAVSMGGLCVNLLVFGTVHSKVLESLGALPALYIGQIAAVGSAMVWNFLANRLITYNDVH